MTNETASALIQVAAAYHEASRPIPTHVRCELLDIVRCDELAVQLRSHAQQLLGDCE